MNLNFFRRKYRRAKEFVLGEKKFDVEDEIKISREKILEDMKKLAPKFDLRKPEWRENPERFLKEFFDPQKKYTTNDIVVPERFREWIIGQDSSLKRVELSEIEWLKTLKQLQELEKKHAQGIQYSKILRERPTNNILLLGEPGTGKSMILKVMAEDLKEKYEKEGIELEDVVVTEDKINRYSANVRYLRPAGIGRKLVEYAQIRESQRARKKNMLIFGGIGTIIALGVLLLSLGIRQFVLSMLAGIPFEQALLSVSQVYFYLGITMISTPIFVIVWLWLFRGANVWASEGETLKIPNLIVDNDPKQTEMYVNATVISDSALFGSVEWSPFQTGSMAKPPYRRVVAGAVHKANKKILYIDEIRNLTPSQVIKLLTIMEDGEMPIQEQQQVISTGGTAGQNIITPPIKAMFFLLAAGNLDVLTDPHSILNQFPALRDRFENYGDIIVLRDEVEATPLNEMLIIQVIRDELYRFQFPPMEAQAVRHILDYVKRRASDKNHIKLMFRAVIKILKRSAQLAWKDGDTIIREKHVIDAIENYVISVERQMIEQNLEKRKSITLVKVSGKEVGIVNGLSVIPAPHGNEGAGEVIQVQSFLQLVDKPSKAHYEVTGVVRGEEADIQDSKREVRTAIFRLYGIDIEKDCYTHIKFSQTKVDGPSAGITMTLAIMSWLGDPADFRERWQKHIEIGGKPSEFQLKPIPLRQDIAVTGAMEIREEVKNDIRISAVGGIYEKVRAAQRYGIKYVIIPKENYEAKILGEKQFAIKVIPASTVLDYFEAIRGDTQDVEGEK